MGNIVEKIGAMVARLGTKLANNYGGSVSNRYIVLHAPAGTNNERLDPNCAMGLGEFAQVLGVMKMGANLPKSADFNDYKTYGYYQFDTWNAEVSGGSNYPFLNAFGLMLVYDLNTIALQACLDIDGGRIAIRKYIKQNQTWGGWFEFQHSS